MIMSNFTTWLKASIQRAEDEYLIMGCAATDAEYVRQRRRELNTTPWHRCSTTVPKLCVKF